MQIENVYECSTGNKLFITLIRTWPSMVLWLPYFENCVLHGIINHQSSLKLYGFDLWLIMRVNEIILLYTDIWFMHV